MKYGSLKWGMRGSKLSTRRFILWFGLPQRRPYIHVVEADIDKLWINLDKKQRCAQDQSLDKLDNFWIDLNEATAMRPIAKAQIYSVKRKLTSKSSCSNVRRPWLTWKNSSKKKRKGEVAEKVQRNCKVCCIGCVSSFSGPLQLIFIA